MTDQEQTLLTEALWDHRPSPEQPANILWALLAVQKALGRVPVEAVGLVARTLAVPTADVAGVLSYYPDLHTEPRGRHVIRVCLGEACVANRSPGLLADLRRDLGIELGQTTQDGSVTLERVYCLGNCAVGPTVMVNDRVYGRVTRSRLRQILNSGNHAPVTTER